MCMYVYIYIYIHICCIASADLFGVKIADSLRTTYDQADRDSQAGGQGQKPA